jgi:hypothetical protein
MSARNPDREIIAMVAEFKKRDAVFERLHAIEDAHGYRSPEGQAAAAEVSRIVQRGWKIRARVTKLVAKTPEGLAAKAWLALWETCDGVPEEGPSACEDHAVAWSLARDILERAGA